MRLQVERQTASPSERASAAAPREVERDALAQLDRRDMVREPDERVKRSCEVAPGEREPRDDTSAKPPSAR